MGGGQKTPGRTSPQDRDGIVSMAGRLRRAGDSSPGKLAGAGRRELLEALSVWRS